VVGAATPQAALDRIRFDSFALALVDLALGGADGLALIRAFRASPNPHLQSLPIVVVSRCADEGVVRCALDAGADGFVAKPPTIASFNRQVSCALSKRAAANVFELE
jgi:two-component system chemotaxis response regulator CheY